MEYWSFHDQRPAARLEVVGESNYQNQIEHVIGGTVGSVPERSYTAYLVPEPSNPVDRNAIVVHLLTPDESTGYVVGYLSREAAMAYAPVLQRLRPLVIRASARVIGGRGGPAGVVLNLGTPAELLATVVAASLPEERPDHPWTGKTVCFTGPSGFGIEGVRLDREAQMLLATRVGCEVWPRMTKKVHLCVTSDPDQETGKLARAEAYGVETVREADFWPAVGLGTLERWR